jgi:hypothetical protein
MSMEPEGYGAEGPRSPAARSKTSTPGILLIVVGILNILLGLWCVISGINGMLHPPSAADFEKARAQMTPEQRKQMEEAEKVGFGPEQIQKYAAAGGPTNLGLGIINVLGGVVTLLGGVKMRNLQSYGLAMFGSILAIIPCISLMGCCVLGEVAGIWALVVLMNQDVKSAFR